MKAVHIKVSLHVCAHIYQPCKDHSMLMRLAVTEVKVKTFSKQSQFIP